MAKSGAKVKPGAIPLLKTVRYRSSAAIPARASPVWGHFHSQHLPRKERSGFVLRLSFLPFFVLGNFLREDRERAKNRYCLLSA